MPSLNYDVKKLSNQIYLLQSGLISVEGEVNELLEQKTVKYIPGFFGKTTTMASQETNTVKMYVNDGVTGSGSDWPEAAAGIPLFWMVTTIGDDSNPPYERIYQQAIQIFLTDTRKTNLLLTRVKHDSIWTPWRPVGLQDILVNMTDNTVNLAYGNYFVRTGISGAQTFSITGASNVQDSTCITIILDVTTVGATSVTWWANIRWDGGVAPAFTSNGRTTIGFISKDKGATWDGYLLGKDMK